MPTIRLENLSPDQIRAYVITDNRLAEEAGWDTSILAIEFQHLLDVESDFDITVTGFEVPEIDSILSLEGSESDADDLFEVDEGGSTSYPIGRTCGNLANIGSCAEAPSSKSATRVYSVRSDVSPMSSL